MVDLRKRATIRPNSRNASRDFDIPAEKARDLYELGVLHGDATNGGYVPATPNLESAVRQFLMPHSMTKRK